MATISSLGTGSGLDLSGMLTKLMTVEAQPLTLLNTKEASYTAKLTAYGTLKGATSSLQTAVDSLASSTLFDGNSAVSSNTAAITASASTAAKQGTYSLKVIDKAQAQTLATATFASMTTAVNGNAAAKLKIELGNYDSSGNTFTANTNRTAATIDVAANASLADIRDAINAANAGVTAALVSVGAAGYKLTLTSDYSGADNSVKLTAMDSSNTVLNDNTGLARVSFDPTAAAGAGKELTVTTVAQDAHFQLNGIDLYRSSNSVSDAITGVTLQLVDAGSSTLTISQNTSAISASVDSFIKAYNDLNTQIKSLTAYDSTNKKAATLTGDALARNLQSNLRSLLTTRVDTGVAGIASLSDVGISLQKDGSLSFDASKLSTALKTSSDAVKKLFSAKTSATSTVEGIATKMSSALDSMLANTGLFASKTDGINSSIKAIDARKEELNRRLTMIEANYKAQFTALDSFVAKMQSTSSYLTQQLSALTSSSSSSK